MRSIWNIDPTATIYISMTIRQSTIVIKAWIYPRHSLRRALRFRLPLKFTRQSYSRVETDKVRLKYIYIFIYIYIYHMVVFRVGRLYFQAESELELQSWLACLREIVPSSVEQRYVTQRECGFRSVSIVRKVFLQKCLCFWLGLYSVFRWFWLAAWFVAGFALVASVVLEEVARNRKCFWLVRWFCFHDFDWFFKMDSWFWLVS